MWKPVVVALIGVLGGSHLMHKHQDKVDRFFMGIFRDIGRHKALKRRHANSKGLISTVILKQDNPLLDLDLEKEDETLDNIATYTASELEEFGSGLDGQPILIALFGRVYDVSAGKKFYGPDGHYHVFAGHDVTYALSTGCFRDYECVENRSVQELTEKELSEGKRWLSFFHLHDKYPFVGKLEEGNYVETLLRDLIEQAEKDAEAAGGDKPLQPPILPQ